MSFILPLLSFFMGQAKSFIKEPGVAFTQQLVLHIRSLTLLLVAIISSLTLSLVGVCLFISSLANQLDKQEELSFTGGMTLYLVVTVISLAFLAYSLSQKKWLKTSGLVEAAKPQRTAGTLESAVSLLVMDFVQERKFRRENSSAAENSKPQA